MSTDALAIAVESACRRALQRPERGRGPLDLRYLVWPDGDCYVAEQPCGWGAWLWRAGRGWWS